MKNINIKYFSTIDSFLLEIKQNAESTISTFCMIPFSGVHEDTPTSMAPYQMNFYQISYIESSENSSISLNASQDTLINKTVYFVSPEHVLSWKWAKDVEGYIIFFDKSFINFSNIDFEETFNDLFDFRKDNLLSLSTENSSNLKNDFDKLFTDYSKESLFKKEIIQASLLTLLYKLKHIYLISESIKERPLTRTQSKYKEFENLIRNSFISQKSVGFYAEKLNVGPNYLNEICQKIVQKNAKKIIQEFIINEASKRLLYSTDDISEISFELGFVEPTHFIRFFKQQMKVSPKKFRDQNMAQ